MKSHFSNLNLKLSLFDWNNIRNPVKDWYFLRKEEKIRLIEEYLKRKK